MSSPKKRNNSVGKAGPRPGDPKKGGAGGKGTWGGLGDEAKSASYVDRNDPNYDSGDEAKSFVPRPLPAIVIFKNAVQPIIDEYFVSGDAEEVGRALKELNSPQFHQEFVKISVSKAMEKHDRERELVSHLLPSLYPNCLSYEKIAEGFSALLERLQDLKLDTPTAPELLSMFLARAVIDDVLPPSFLSPDTADEELAKDTLQKAWGLTRGKHAGSRLAHIWGPGGEQSVKRLKERILVLLEDYIVQQDLLAADRQVRDLNSPHFHYQVAKKAAQLCVESSDEKTNNYLSQLLAQFHKSGLISTDHMVAGFKIIADTISDIELDTPLARPRFVALVERATAEGYLPPSFREIALSVKEKSSTPPNAIHQMDD
eukprot:TRINITY_DN2077_c0_g2_i3.p1 TRINITY_DN2077_c0_g2~~TRINITY_DN2077_c0_g2_i3.p1  ORF type:complete len:372 (-),score=90.49 TRINITY_DN2077_c0_g2_i3:171-1286(-)